MESGENELNRRDDNSIPGFLRGAPDQISEGGFTISSSDFNLGLRGASEGFNRLWSMKTNLLRKFSSIFIQIGALVSALMCSSTLTHAGPVLPAVGPSPPGEYQKVSCGYLEVYSATEESSPAGVSDGDDYYPHTAYWIYNASGKRIRTVQNHGIQPEDTGPEKVELTPGTYVVKAWSDKDGLVTVPVVIKLARTTTVHLENGTETENSQIFDPSKAVKSPSGQVVGWKA